MALSIHSRFDGGNIEVVSADSADAIVLKIRPDAGDEHLQWFYFQLCDAAGQSCRMTIENAGEVSYPAGFENYRAVCSSDRIQWRRVPTRFDGKRLIIEDTPDVDVVEYAYFAPYSLDRHRQLIADALDSSLVRAESLCTTPDGHAHTLLTIGQPDSGRQCLWITARQHPGETMAEWWVEGFLDRLLDEEDPVARRLLEQAVVYLVPNMCIDGSVRGHLRCNAHGRNLNREWREPSAEFSPEVYYVIERMRQTGVDFSLDVHGDEELPYNFIAGSEGIASWNASRQIELDNFKDLLATISPDFQTRHGYAVGEPGSADLRKCTDWVGETFGCLAMTLEMPFKDSDITPLPATAWSPERSRHMGRACIDAIAQWLEGRA
ncbi:M14 family metallopeptidase [Wenzhouxiangella limi]|uniref:Carboxypeptidase family protein n=1 Tax=Wenzhouxiangella limi TaxID=2707351 RepID=A0A845V0V3_9GAMM|nr:M14-type cytosolic carboxypeptidase [Wenzhouxiangella limi]NDY96698.1 carboxypeptidase family protein [Wenzhouxiangella limi]